MRTVEVADLLPTAQSLADGADAMALLDWYARRVDGPGSAVEAVMQLRSASGDRSQLTVVDAAEVPSLRPIWPAVAWPQREAVERIGLRCIGEPLVPLWTAAVRAAHDEEDGADDGCDPDGSVYLGDAGVTTHLRLDLRATLSGRLVDTVQARPGKTHSGFEALATRHGYAQLAPLAEGLNEQAPCAAGLAAILAVERLLQVQPPPRCRRLRMLLAELSRIGAHCAWLASQAGADEILWGQALVTREAVAHLLADITGRRWATGVHRVGGVAADVTDQTDRLFASLAASVDQLQTSASRRLLEHGGWRRRFAGVAAIDSGTAGKWALTGPALRATGLALDVRRDAPYLDYADLDFDIPVGTRGDVADRVAVRLEEMRQSIRIGRQILADLPDGTSGATAPATPMGTAELIRHFELWMDGHGHRTTHDTVYCPTESADGELAMWLAADGTGKPAAVHLRSPSLFNFQLLEHLLPGTAWDDAAAVVASLNIVAPEMDR